MNYGFIRNGVVDDITYYRAHVLKDVFTYDNPNYQKEFFKKVKEKISDNDTIYTLGQVYIPKIYLNNREIKSLEKIENSQLPSNAYVILTYGMIMEGVVTQNDINWMKKHCELIVKEGDYYLFLKY